jgi:tetrapyrrole methylase family protein/MazG family protein
VRAAADALERLGLAGPAQVHVAPVALVPDERAHQVFLGFEADGVRRALRRYPPTTPVLPFDGPPTDLERLTRGDCAVPALRHDSPGGLYGLVQIVDRLLGPGGCPWDQEQTHESLRRHMVEEAYELVEAIESGDPAALREELGDVLLQPVMHAQMDERDGLPGIDAVAAAVSEKLVRRHPHVFGDLEVSDAATVLQNWDSLKSAEKPTASVLGGVSRSMPALLQANELGKRAARQGFDWPDVEGVWEKLHEEAEELREAWGTERASDELGDLLFAAVNLGRWAGVDAEEALRAQCRRFVERFDAMALAAGGSLRGLSLDEMEALWSQAKADGPSGPQAKP